MLTWQVYIEDINERRIKTCDIFKHCGFLDDCKKAAKKYRDDKETFLSKVRSSLMYYFWSKCEYEIVLTSWPLPRVGYHFDDRKVDIYQQVMLNWHVFSEYVWEHRAELSRRTRKPRQSEVIA